MEGREKNCFRAGRKIMTFMSNKHFKIKTLFFLFIMIINFFCLVGCELIKPVPLPNIEMHRLLAGPVVGSHCAFQRRETLLISPMGSASAFDTKRMAYQAQPNQINYFALHQWSETPLLQWTQLFIEYQIKSRHFKNTILAPAIGNSDYMLQFYLLEAIQDFTINPAQARFKILVTLTHVHTRRIISTQVFLGQAYLSQNNPQAGVKAMQEAVNDLLETISCWLKRQK